LEEPDLLLAGSMIEKKNGRDALAQIAVRLLNAKGHKPTAPYLSFAQLPMQTVVSFYPDPVLESLLLNQNPPFQLLIEDGDLSSFSAESNRLLYLLGGSALSGKGLVLTYENYHRLQYRIEVLARGLRDRLALQTLLLIGGDMSDLNLKELYLEATKHLSSSRRRPIYVVSTTNPEQWLGPCHILNQRPLELFESLSRVVPVSRPTTKAPVLSTTQVEKKRLPYKYLDYFESEDADLFFGREQEGNEISREILASPSRVTVLCGRSGVGKTSLVKARLIPGLEQDKDIKTTYTRFGGDPEKSILNALQTHIIKEGIKDEITPGDIKSVLKTLFHRNYREHVLFLDQTEEAFIKLGKELLDSFFKTARECVSGADTGAYIVFVIREDYLGWLAKYKEHFPGLLTSVCRLQELTYESAVEVIIKPAKKCGFQVEDILVEEILNDLHQDNRILPAHLQIVLERIYQEANGRALTLETYQEAGRAARILKGYVEDAISRLPVDLESTARKVLKAMVTSEHTKDTLSLNQIVKRTRLPRQHLERAVHDMIQQRLLREVPGDPVHFELFHESLVDSISKWLEEKELKIRGIQEILEQEVSNVRKFKEFQFPLDKLHLIDEHRDYLELDEDSINVVFNAFLISSQLSEFWMNKLKEVKGDRYYEFIIKQCLFYELDKLANLKSSGNMKIIEEALLNGVLLGSEYYVDLGIKLALTLEEILEDVISAIFLGLKKVSNERAELIYKNCISYAERSQEFLVALNMVTDNHDILENLAKKILPNTLYNETLYGSEYSEITLKVIFMDTSGNSLAAIFNSLDKVPEKRAENILRTCNNLTEKSQKFLAVMKAAMDQYSIANPYETVIYGIGNLETAMNKIFIDSSGNALAATFYRLNELPDERIGLILKTCEYSAAESPLYLSSLKSSMDKQGIPEELANLALFRTKDLFDATMKIILTDSSGNALKALFRRLDDVPERVELVLKICKLYAERSKQFADLLKSIKIKQDISIKNAKVIKE
jgi:GTP-binding protein EngB required for normal cell division